MAPHRKVLPALISVSTLICVNTELASANEYWFLDLWPFFLNLSIQPVVVGKFLSEKCYPDTVCAEQAI